MTRLLNQPKTVRNTSKIRVLGRAVGGVIIKYQNREIIINSADLLDYKVFCFNGEPKLIEVDYNRFVNHKRNLYTPNWQLIEASIGYPSEEGRTFERPLLLEKMLDAACKLSKGIPHVRVDFYITNNRLLFGELTFYHGSGMEKTEPKEFDYILGNLINIPIK